MATEKERVIGEAWKKYEATGQEYLLPDLLGDIFDAAIELAAQRIKAKIEAYNCDSRLQEIVDEEARALKGHQGEKVRG